MILPIQVRRSTPSTPPGADPASGTNPASDGSAARMVRNFRQSNTLPSRPTRGWRKKIGGLEVDDAKRLKALEDENRRLKRMVADLSLDKQMLQDVLSRKW